MKSRREKLKGMFCFYTHNTTMLQQESPPPPLPQGSARIQRPVAYAIPGRGMIMEGCPLEEEDDEVTGAEERNVPKNPDSALRSPRLSNNSKSIKLLSSSPPTSST